MNKVEVLNNCLVYSGINYQMKQEDYVLISDFIGKFYPSLSLKNILEAFQLYAAGKLGDFEAFQNFSPRFVGKVLSAYKEHQRKENLKPKVIKVEKQLTEGQEDPTGKRAFEFIQKVVKESGEPPIIANWDKAFKYAQNQGLIKLTDSQKNKLKQKVERELSKERANKRNLAASISTLSAYDINTTEIKKQCRRKALIEYLKNEN